MTSSSRAIPLFLLPILLIVPNDVPCSTFIGTGTFSGTVADRDSPIQPDYYSINYSGDMILEFEQELSGGTFLYDIHLRSLGLAGWQRPLTSADWDSAIVEIDTQGIVSPAPFPSGPYPVSVSIDGVINIGGRDLSVSVSHPDAFEISISGVVFESGNGVSLDLSFTSSFPVPNAPSGLSAKAVSVSRIDLRWIANSHFGDFEIQRKSGEGGTYSSIGSTKIDMTTFQDTGLNEGTTYFYRVRAIGQESTFSDWSSEALATTTPTEITITVASREYADVGFPIIPSNGTLLNALLENLGMPGKGEWRLGYWESSRGSYVELGEEFRSVAVGLGYWLVASEDQVISISGFPVSVLEYTRDLNGGTNGTPGWNQLSNPFQQPIAVSTLQVVTGERPRVFLKDPRNDLTEPRILIWDNTSRDPYQEASEIPGASVFWLAKTSPEEVKLIIPQPMLTLETNAPDSNLDIRANSSERPPDATWVISIRAHQGSLESKPLLLGIAPVREGGWNRLNFLLAPPPPVGNYPILYVPKTTWGQKNGDYVREFQPDADVSVWEFVLRTPSAFGPIILEIIGFDIPPDRKLHLRELGGSLDEVLVLPGTLPIDGTQESRVYRLTAFTEDSHQSKVKRNPMSMSVRPNPFTEGASMFVTLTETTVLQVMIFDLQGRIVRRLYNRFASSGTTSIFWNGKDDSGRAVGAGVYFVQYRGGDTQRVTRVVKLER